MTPRTNATMCAASAHGNRLTLAVLCLAATAGVSCLAGHGNGYLGLLLLVAWFLWLRQASQAHADRVWQAGLWASVAAGVIAIIQLPWLDRPSGPFGSPNYLGAFAAVMLLVAWGRFGETPGERGKLPQLALIANAAALALSQSRGAILAAGAGFAVALGRRRPLLAVGLCCAAIGVALVLQRPESRIAVWQYGLQAGLARPLTGWGIGGFGNIFLIDGRLVHLSHFYSVPLDWFVATGILGVAVATWILVEVWRSGDEGRAALAAWIVAGLFLSAAWPMWLVLFALLARSGRVEIPGDEADPVAVIDHREPLADRGARALRAE